MCGPPPHAEGVAGSAMVCAPPPTHATMGVMTTKDPRRNAEANRQLVHVKCVGGGKAILGRSWHIAQATLQPGDSWNAADVCGAL